MIKRILGLLLLSSCAYAFNPIQYVQISTQPNTPATPQAGAINISTATISSATITTLNLANGAKPLQGKTFFRRPNLYYNGTTSVGLESGNDGIAGETAVLFPDGSLYQENTSTSTKLIATVSNTGNWGVGPSAGLRPTETLTNNSWLAFYVIKDSVTANTTDFALICSTWQPTQANYGTLNTNFGTNSWVYVGMTRYGDGNAIANNISSFTQSGNMTMLYNNNAQSNNNNGITMANTGSATSLTYQVSLGTGVAQIPANFNLVQLTVATGSNTGGAELDGFNGQPRLMVIYSNAQSLQYSYWITAQPAPPNAASPGIKANITSTTNISITLTGWIDNALMPNGFGGLL